MNHSDLLMQGFGLASFFIVFIISVVFYLIGSIPTGYLYCQYFFRIDVTRYGSKNIGATNVARVLGRHRYFFLIFFLDFFKAFFALLVASRVLGALELPEVLFVLCAPFLLIGNGYSLFLWPRGGKGVSTTLGILAFLFPYLFVGFLFVWLVFAIGLKRIDVASLAAIVAVVPNYLVFYGGSDILTLFVLVFIVLFVVFRHKENITKLLKRG